MLVTKSSSEQLAERSHGMSHFQRQARRSNLVNTISISLATTLVLTLLAIWSVPLFLWGSLKRAELGIQ